MTTSVLRIVAIALVAAATTVSCGDSGEHQGGPADGSAPPAAANAPVVKTSAPTTTTIGPLIAWIEESEPELGPAPLTVKFISVVKGGTPPYQYKWIFGDDSAESTEPNPVHTYTEPGLYWPELYVTDSGGDEDDDTTVVEAE